MNRFLRIVPAFACATLLAAAPALAQAGSDDADAAKGQDNDAPATGSPALPGVVLERNVFLPVDSSGRPASNEFIVVERREMTKDKDADAAAPAVPTRFILVPQESLEGSNEDGQDTVPPAQR
jgi:hypothetical protein